MILCDGDCGNCYHEKDMNYIEGYNLCKECMFNFMAEKRYEEPEC